MIRNLTIPLGVNEAGRFIEFSLHKFPHLFIIGKEGVNKRDFIRAITTTLMKQNTSNDVNIVYIGSSWLEIKESPYLFTPVGSDHKSIWNAIGAMKKELKRRSELAGTKESETWKTIIFVCEEQEILHTNWYEETSVLLNIISEGHRVGIHALFMTSNQHASSHGCKTKLVFALDRPKESKEYLGISDAAKFTSPNEAYFVEDREFKPIKITVSTVIPKGKAIIPTKFSFNGSDEYRELTLKRESRIENALGDVGLKIMIIQRESEGELIRYTVISGENGQKLTVDELVKYTQVIERASGVVENSVRIFALSGEGYVGLMMPKEKTDTYHK